MKISHPKLTSHGMPSCVERLVLLHSPLIIDMNTFKTIQETVMDDEIDDDMNTCEMCDFFSTTKLVTGCIYKMEQNSFAWIYEIELNIQYKKIGGLMNFLLDCSVEDVNDKICMFD